MRTALIAAVLVIASATVLPAQQPSGATAGRSADAFATENPLLGTWKLKAFVREVLATGERYNQRGEHPKGFISYSADGRMYAIIVSDNRINPHNGLRQASSAPSCMRA